MLLESIANPSDLRRLSYEQLDELAGEMRDQIVSTPSRPTTVTWAPTWVWSS